MELYQEILYRILANQKLQVTFPDLNVNPAEIIELECYKILQKIKDIIKDDTLDDSDCFTKIEEIVCLFESLGIDSGERHDY